LIQAEYLLVLDPVLRVRLVRHQPFVVDRMQFEVGSLWIDKRIERFDPWRIIVL
jgi:hypothetical protein